MRVLINGIWYDSEETIIHIELNKADKKNIAKMDDDKFNYICFPDKIKLPKLTENQINEIEKKIEELSNKEFPNSSLINSLKAEKSILNLKKKLNDIHI